MNHAPSASRRAVLAGAGGLLTTALLSACATAAPSVRTSSTPSTQQRRTSTSTTPTSTTSPTATPVPTPTPTATPVSITPQPLPGGTITGLPTGTPGIAWTVDDGVDSSVVEAYARFALETGTRLTFFVNGANPSWTEHADLLRPLVASGQVQIGNHTWDHPALTRLSDQGIADELQRNHDFIASTYGVDARPFYRPPFGYHDARVDAAAARIGYSTPVLWYGSLADSGDITTDQIVGFGEQWFLPAHIVIGHANHQGTIAALPRLHQLLRDRQLATFTLRDVFAT